MPAYTYCIKSLRNRLFVAVFYCRSNILHTYFLRSIVSTTTSCIYKTILYHIFLNEHKQILNLWKLALHYVLTKQSQKCYNLMVRAFKSITLLGRNTDEGIQHKKGDG